jgi:hypothetical protein
LFYYSISEIDTETVADLPEQPGSPELGFFHFGRIGIGMEIVAGAVELLTPASR